MTDKCIVSDWFANRSKLNIQTFTVDGFPFEIMTLTDDAKDLIELCETYKEMVSLASNEGLSSNRSRVMDNEEFAKDIELFWADKFKDDDSDPCVRSRVGEKVCEISGLASVLNDMLEAEKAEDERVFQLGSHEVTGSTALEDLPEIDDENLKQDAALYANEA